MRTPLEAALPASQTERPYRVKALDGVRAIAVAAVVIYHLWPQLLPGGFLGVDLFFVLSGFLITASLRRELDSKGRISLSRFWVRRVRRILPAVLLVLLLAVAAAGVIGGSVAVRLRPQLFSALTFTNNWYQAFSGTSYFDHSNPPLFQHLWSLAVEEQFYLLWPLVVVVLLMRVRRLRVCAAVIYIIAVVSAVAMAIGFIPGQDPSRLYFGTDTHGFPLLIGSAAAFLDAKKVRMTALIGGRHLRGLMGFGVPALVVCFTGFLIVGETSALAYRGGIVLFAVSASVLVWTLTNTSDGLGRHLSAPPLLWLGRRSYGIYLWHWPILVLVSAAAPGAPELIRGLAVVLPTILMASLSWRYLERPVLALGLRGAANSTLARLTASGSKARVASMAVVVVLLTSATLAVVQSPAHTVTEDQIVSGQRAIAQSRSHASAPTTGPSSKVVSDDPAAIGARTTVIGDSVTLASTNALLAGLPGIEVNAEVGQQMRDAPRIISELKASGSLRQNIVIALGTNGDFPPVELDQLLSVSGQGHQFVFVTAHMDRQWTESVNTKLRNFVKTRTNTRIADWNTASQAVTDFAPDGIHPGLEGAGIFEDTIAKALRSLNTKT